MPYPLAQLNPDIFRAYDIRGIVGHSLTEATVYHIGRAFAAAAAQRDIREVVVAADGRLSGPSLKQILTQGLTDSGCQVLDIGYLPTPALYFAAHQRSDQTGIMITGSHNPADYNGFKMMLGGDTLSGDQIQALARCIERREYVEGTGSARPLAMERAYRDRILEQITLKRPLKVVVDCGNGIAGAIAPELLQQLGCEVIPLFCEVDGTFPNHRVGVITPSGHVVYPDRVMMLFAEDLLSRNPGAEILFDVKCSRLLPRVIERAGGKATMWKTGHSLIKRQMKASGALLAGEMSGHIFFKERWYGFDDGLYSAARLLEILSGRDEDADAIFSAYPEDISTPEINIEVRDDNKFALVEALQRVEFPGGRVSHIDGVRVDYPDGWGLVRASNTTPVLVLRFEAENATALARIKHEFQSRLSQIDPGLSIPEA
jgi:phosphomannomutase/phosphoglucomutase